MRALAQPASLDFSARTETAARVASTRTTADASETGLRGVDGRIGLMSIAPASILAIQRLAGNAAVTELIDRFRGSNSTVPSTVQRCPGGCTDETVCDSHQILPIQRNGPAGSARAATSLPPTRAERLQDLLNDITGQTQESQTIREQLLVAPDVDRADLDQLLDRTRQDLIDLLRERIGLLDLEITDLNALIGPNRESSEDQRSDIEALNAELVRREAEKRRDESQLRPLVRWRTRREITAIDSELAEIARELALPPQTRPSDQEARLLTAREADLRAHKRVLAGSLTSTATRYRQTDERWASANFGNCPLSTHPEMGWAGCGPTSLAILLNFFYQEDPEGLAASGNFEIVAPPEAATYAATHGRTCGHGVDRPDVMITNVATQWPGFTGRALRDVDEVTRQLHSGNLVIFHCFGCMGRNPDGGPASYSAHYMVLNGVSEDGTVYNVLDPALGNMVTISASQLRSGNVTWFGLITPK